MNITITKEHIEKILIGLGIVVLLLLLTVIIDGSPSNFGTVYFGLTMIVIPLIVLMYKKD